MSRQNTKTASKSKPARKPVAKRGSKKVKQPLFASHRYTFRLMSSAHTSYPLVFLLMLLLGVIIFNWSSVASGLDYTVKAKVPAPPLTEPATITSPADGSTFKAVPIQVNGRCPIDSYVKLYRNGYFSGVALCQSDGTFHLQSDLFEGANSLLAQDYNITDDAGPTSSPITVYYKPLQPPVPVSNSNPNVPVAQPLLISSEFLFQGYYVGQQVNWQFTLAGGTAPYAVHIDWGDGNSDTISRNAAGSFGVSHKYVRLPKGASYTIKAYASDSAGSKGFVQLLALINGRPDAASAMALGGNSLGGTGLGSALQPLEILVKYVSPTYLICLLVLLAFWLGERREFEILHHFRKHRPHTP